MSHKKGNFALERPEGCDVVFFFYFDLISFNSIAKQFDVSLFNVGTNLFSYNNNFFVSYTPDTLYEYIKTNLDQNHNLQLEKINKYDFVLLHLFHTHISQTKSYIK